MPRLFMAVRVPANEPLRRVVARLKNVRGVAATPPDNLHYTLRFFGDVPDEALHRLRGALAERSVATPTAFPVDIVGTGAFPDGRRPRVVWAGCDPAAHPYFAQLADAVDAWADQCALGPRDKPFVPHLTLARVKRVDGRGADEVKRLLHEEAETRYGQMRADRFVLVESTLTPAGSRYTDLVEVPLA